jgi:hypothetical protein
MVQRITLKLASLKLIKLREIARGGSNQEQEWRRT